MALTEPAWKNPREGYDNLAAKLADELKRVERQGLDQTPMKMTLPVFSHQTAASFLSVVLSPNYACHLPVVKVVVPALQGEQGYGTGSIFYIAKVEDRDMMQKQDPRSKPEVHVFRGTFGYGGRGPLDSALVEFGLKDYQMQTESADGLLQSLGLDF